MANFAIFNVDTGRLKSILRSQHTPDFINRPDALKLDKMPEGNIKYMMVKNNKIKIATAEEKKAIDELLKPEKRDKIANLDTTTKAAVLALADLAKISVEDLQKKMTELYE